MIIDMLFHQQLNKLKMCRKVLHNFSLISTLAYYHRTLVNVHTQFTIDHNNLDTALTPYLENVLYAERYIFFRIGRKCNI